MCNICKKLKQVVFRFIPIIIVLFMTHLGYAQVVPNIQKTIHLSGEDCSVSRDTIIVGPVANADINVELIALETVTVTYCYTLVNPFNVPLNLLEVVDDMGTSDNPADDVVFVTGGVSQVAGAPDNVPANSTVVWSQDVFVDLNQLTIEDCQIVNQISIEYDSDNGSGSISDTANIVGLFSGCPPDFIYTCEEFAAAFPDYGSIEELFNAINGNLGLANTLFGKPDTGSCCNDGGPVFREITFAGTTCAGVITRTWDIYFLNCATDPFDRTFVLECSQNIELLPDTTPPIISADQTFFDFGCNPENINTTVIVTDNCDMNLTATPSDSAPLIEECQYTITRTWNATDSCGNSAEPFVQTITWKEDTEKPVITGEVELFIGCNPSESDKITSVSVSDNCDVDLTATFTDDDVIQELCFFTLIRDWTVTDSCGNIADVFRQTITWVEDAEKPVISGESIVELGCNPLESDKLTFVVTTDNCDLDIEAVSSDSGPVSNGCVYTLTRVWNAVDLCGNEADPFTQTITWKEDEEAPVISGEETVDLGCNPDSIDTAVSATDNCDGDLIAEPSDGPIEGECVKTLVRTWTAMDSCGNEGAFTQTITWKEDMEAPVISGEATVDLGCNPDSIDTAVSATDNCDGDLIAEPSDGPIEGECVKTLVRTWTVMDSCGNEGVFTQTITWKEDMEAPVITGQDLVDLGLNPTEFGTTVSVTDNCDIDLDASSNDGPIDGDCLKTMIRTWTAIDSCGNEGVFVQTITWKEDRENPVITGEELVEFGCNPDNLVTIVTVTDNCDIDVPATPSDGPVEGDCFKTMVRTWSATDSSGNTGIFVQTLTWKEDVVAPVLICLPIDLEGCDAAIPAPDANTVLVEDNCDVGLVASHIGDSDPIQNGCIVTVIRTWMAVDGCDNSNTCEQTITLKLDPPKIHGYKFEDMNGNNAYDGGEGLSGWVITLTDADGNVMTTTTDSNGEYWFMNLEPGVYAIDEQPQTGWQAVSSLPISAALECCDVVEINIQNERVELAGCTPGYWKNNARQKGAVSWGPTGYSPDQSLSSVFNLGPFDGDFGDDSLLDALNYGGGGGAIGAARNLLRHAVAALLNASHPDINYGFPGSVIEAVNSALATNNRAAILSLASDLDEYNNEGCPIDQFGRLNNW